MVFLSFINDKSQAVYYNYISKHAKPLRHKVLTAIMASVISIGFVTGAVAAKLGIDANTSVGAGASPSVGVGAGVGAGVNSDASVGQAGSTPDSHMSTSGSTHTKAQWGSGTSRAPEGSSERTTAHSHTHSNAHVTTKHKE